DLQQRIIAQTVGVVAVLVTGDDLIQTLPQQGDRAVLHAILISRIAQRQQPGVAGDLSVGKIGVDGLMAVEGEGQLW
ncbi:MAG TPA: hypothetical protein VGS27_06695, partial [Candidatus Sulfotelmatobacter sp.]|nr:hypothetical protein [Candidatus Sulfotelmatobacter sp.]